MEKLSEMNERWGWFTYMGKPMPLEFSQVCKLDMFQSKIAQRGKDTWRFYTEFKRFLEKTYEGDLPKNMSKLAQKFGYPQYIQDLMYMDEQAYRLIYKKEYADMFENKTQREKEQIFQMSDWGGRNVFEYRQDVMASALLEDMITYHTKGILSPNDAASGRKTERITTNCDFVFRNPSRPDRPNELKLPVELKTKWKRYFDKDETISMRGSVNTLMRTGGMVLAIYMKMNKAVLIDPQVNDYRISSGSMAGGKDCDKIHINREDVVDFKFWVKDDVIKLMHMIYDSNKKRGTK